MPNHPKTIKISGFQGINNLERPENTPSQFLKEAVNLDFSKNGDVTKRLGYEKVYDGTNMHSIYANNNHFYFVENGILKYLQGDLSAINLDANAGNQYVDYEELNGLVYYVNKTTTGILDGEERKNFGIEPPRLLLTLSEGSGSLYEGKYQVAYSYVNTEGKESGCRIAAEITVGDRASIHISNIPTASASDIEYIPQPE